jgi:hypothetical protein
MKNLFFLILIAVFLISCSEPPNSSDKALKSLSKIFTVSAPEDLKDGRMFYEIQAIEVKGNDSIFVNPDIADQKIKGCFDQGLGLLPQKQKLHEFSSARKELYNTYEWETLTETVTIWNNYREIKKTGSIKSETGIGLFTRIWIVKK